MRGAPGAYNLAIASLQRRTLIFVRLAVLRSVFSFRWFAKSRARLFRYGPSCAGCGGQLLPGFLKLGGCNHVFRTTGHQLLYVVLREGNADSHVGVRPEQLRHRIRFSFLHRLHSFEEVDERRWIVAGLIEILKPQQIQVATWLRESILADVSTAANVSRILTTRPNVMSSRPDIVCRRQIPQQTTHAAKTHQNIILFHHFNGHVLLCREPHEFFPDIELSETR